ncbi:conjugal transfer protein TraF [Hydrogenovibrio sp. 3SP14C1]|uniref:conjugal transfer protein TraF n=1 Tax=Hydrogenovibrio sp. 3SP14C1 TaxID=3038774 RepID=UPI002415C0C4|nr:conjugal transfer protein TraF [Hydrogenovibrio sp. 3SP14C1]MDG4811642.1 conjugal transfer protein TraF [Hydrogenovibrio sp. 3SP14C1]
MKKKQLVSAIIALSVSGLTYAAPSSYSPIGTNIGYGDSSNPNSLYNSLANPANNAMNAADTEGYRVGLGATLQTQLKIEGLEGSKDFLDNRIKPILDKRTYTLTNATNLQNETNSFLTTYNQGSFSTISGVTIPLIIKHEAMGGGISFDYTQQVAGKGRLIKKNNVTAYNNGGNLAINSGDAAFGVDYKQLNEFALGYGFDITKSDAGALSLGITARYLNLLSNTKIVDFSQIANDNLGNNTKDTTSYINDIDSGKSDSNYTADIGINWTSKTFMVGLTGMNLTSPKFDVNNKSNATATTDFANQINSKFELKSQYRVMAQWFTLDRNWTLAGSYDLNKANDLNNEDVQWWTVGASYATNSAWYIPDVRFGLRGNLVGSKYTYANAGLTLGFLTLDVSTTTLDFKGVSDKQKNAGVMAAAGVEFDF